MEPSIVTITSMTIEKRNIIARAAGVDLQVVNETLAMHTDDNSEMNEWVLVPQPSPRKNVQKPSTKTVYLT